MGAVSWPHAFSDARVRFQGGGGGLSGSALGSAVRLLRAARLQPALSPEASGEAPTYRTARRRPTSRAAGAPGRAGSLTGSPTGAASHAEDAPRFCKFPEWAWKPRGRRFKLIVHLVEFVGGVVLVRGVLRRAVLCCANEV